MQNTFVLEMFGDGCQKIFINTKGIKGEISTRIKTLINIKKAASAKEQVRLFVIVSLVNINLLKLIQ